MKKTFSKSMAWLLSVVMVLSLLFIVPISVNAANFIQRYEAPSSSDKNFINVNYGGYNRCIAINNSGFVLPNCTGYAWGRAREILGSSPNLSTGNACNWYGYNQSSGAFSYGSTPKVGAIACWSGGDGGYGHVAVVEEIIDNTYTISESGYNWKTFNRRSITNNYYGSSYSFQGFIYIIDGNIPDPVTYDYMPVGEKYYLKNNGTGKYMSIDYGEDVQCKNISVYQFTGDTYQQYEIVGSDTDRSYFLRPVLCQSSGRVVNVNGEYTSNGANVMIYNYTGHSTQQWKFRPVSGGYAICSTNNPNICLTESNTNVQMGNYTGASNQIWTLEPVEHHHNYTEYVYNWAAHPHYKCYRCSCGEVMENRNEPTFVETCPDCIDSITPKGYIMNESEAAGQTIPDGDYYIVSEIAPDYYFDIPGDDFDTPNGANIAMWTWGTTIPDSRGYDCFHFEYLNNGFYKITQINTNMCLNVDGASLNRGANVQMWTYDGNNAQQWSIERTSHGYQLRPRCNAYYLDVYGGYHEPGTNVRCWEGNGSKAQSFSFIPRDLNEQPISDGAYVIRPYLSGQHFLDVAGNIGEFHNGSNVEIWKTSDSPEEDKFVIKYIGDGWYKIIEMTSGLVLEVADIETDFLDLFKNVQVANDNGGKNQFWKIRKNTDGTYYIINKATGYYLDLYFAKTDNGTNVSQHTYNGGDAQKWIFDDSCSAFGHKYILISQKAATCTTNGEKVYRCSKCGDTKTETIKATGHSYTTKIVAPTCMERGYTLHTCTNCGDSYKDTYTNALGHDYELTGETTATCTADGEKSYTCSRCGDTKTEVIKATGHIFIETIIAPTCTTGGYTLHKCENCAESYKDKYTDAAGHKYTEKVIAPTASAKGYTLHTCSVCGHSYKDNYTNKLLVNSTTLTAEDVKLGSYITVNASATGGTGNYTYAVYYKKASESSWTTLQKYSTNSTVKIKPESAEKYDVSVKVKDSNGTIVKKAFTVNVYAPLKNTSTVASANIGFGDSITVKAKAAGGIGEYQYEVYYKQESAAKWTKKQSYSSNSKISFKPKAATTYDISVKVKDGSGTVVKKRLKVNVTKPKNTSTIKASTISLGESIRINCSATGGSGYYQYAVYYKRESATKWSTKQNYSANTSVSIKPSAKTNYNISVKVKDSLGNISKKTFNVTVK